MSFVSHHVFLLPVHKLHHAMQ